MSEKIMQLVYGLVPDRDPRRHIRADGTAARNRFVLVTLAFHADHDGKCAMSYAELSSVTGYTADAVRAAIHDVQQLGLLTVTAPRRGPSQYELNVSELQGRQYQDRQRASASIYQLVDHGLPLPSARRLQRFGWTDVHALAKHIRTYRSEPEPGRPAFHQFLRIPNVGASTAARILAAHDAWTTADQTPSSREGR